MCLTFRADGGELIDSLTSKSASNAFEVDHLRAAAVPEPGSGALLLAGVVAQGLAAGRRKSA